MNIFIIGFTKTGKSTLAEYLSKQFKFKIIESSKSLKDKYPIKNKESKEKYVKRITNTSRKLLKSDLTYFSDSIKKQLTTNNIIVGIRNPIDFISLYNPKKDIIIRTFTNKNIYYSDFEKSGIEIIDSLLLFYTNNVEDPKLIFYNYKIENK
jgi:tRNA A37 N6-isopentenylltransferase MiaA